ncbi:MAG: S9 family peptidase [Gammaproteobacteria bacterium]|nr:S9 family peptidase [Gammaproteobacteria bacterium]
MISRRQALITVAGAALASSVPRAFAAVPSTARRPPVARIEPVSETFFGETIVDPYRWMENPKDPEWEPFMRGQNAYARTVLAAIPGRKRLEQRIKELSGNTVITRAMQSCRGRIFYQKRPRGADNYKLYFRADRHAPEQLLIDPTVLKQDGRHVSLDWWVAAPDGRHVVYGLSPAGSENSVTHVMEVDSREILPERISGTQYASPSWLPDSSGFFYNRLAGAPLGSIEYYQDSIAWLHRLRTAAEADLKVLARGQYAEVAAEPTDFPVVYADPTSDHVVAVLQGGVRRENPHFTASLTDVVAGHPRWRKVCDVADEVLGVAFRADELYLLTTRGAENGKVLKTSLSAPDIGRAAVAVPESDVVIDGIGIGRDALYIQDMNGGYGNLRRLAAEGRVTPIPIPFEGSVAALWTNTQEDGAYWLGTSWLVPLTVLHFDPATGKHSDTGLSPRPPIDLTPYEAIRTEATARDGTKVPLSIIARKGLARDGRHRALVNAYGSYQIVNSPFFDPRGIAFLEQGGVLATAHVRGGGEYGRRWWKAGQKLNKPNTWRDLIDCCEALIRDGWTTSARLAIQGGSAGGITVGRALTERPGLFAAVLSNVGVSNALRAEFSQNGPPNIAEFGSVKDAQGFAALAEMDALHHVKDGVRYPAVLLTTGMQDPRVEPWQPAKMTARLQKASASHNPILLRVTFDAGHGLGSTRTQVDDERADEYAFVLWRTGAPGFQPG